jgi:hypothetical protein
MASSTIIWEQLLPLNALTVLLVGTVLQVLMTPCMMDLFAPEGLIVPRAPEQLLINAQQANTQRKRER